MIPNEKNKPVMNWEKHPNGTMVGTPKLSAAELALMGKPMPQARALEEAVLGAIILFSDAYTLAQGNLAVKIDDFYDERNKIVWQAMQNLGDAQKPIDLLTLAEELKLTNNLYTTDGDSIFKPSLHYLIELTNRVASGANIEYHCKILRQYSIKRGVIKSCHDAMEKAYRDDVDCFDLMNDTQVALGALTDGIGGLELNVMQTTDKILSDATNPESGKNAVKLGYPNLDTAIGGGLRANDYIVLLAGLPGSGKTSLCIGTIIKNMKDGVPTCFISYDMSGEEIVFRLISCYSGISALDMRKGKVKDVDLNNLLEARAWIEKHLHLVTVISAAGMLGNVMVSKMISLSKTKGVKVFMIDYFTAIPLTQSGKFSNETQQQSDLVHAIKNAMQKIGGHTIILSQFTKEGAKKDGRLALADMKGTGELGSQASIAIIINRDGMTGNFDVVKVRNTEQVTLPATYTGNSYRWSCGQYYAEESTDTYGDSLDNFFE
jgi:replicative DNA helicase